MIKITTLIPGHLSTEEVLKLMWAIHKLAPKGASVILERKDSVRQGPVGEEQRRPRHADQEVVNPGDKECTLPTCGHVRYRGVCIEENHPFRYYQPPVPPLSPVVDRRTKGRK
jgi:hypothetical protein